MQVKMIKIFPPLFLLLLLAACSPRLQPFTGHLLTQFDYDEAALERIQFYLSDEIVLQRQLRQGESTIRGGQISIRNGRQVEEIIFPAGTAGVYVFSPGENRFAISFEEGADRYLVFGPAKSDGGPFRLLAKEWKRDYGIITYAGLEYQTPSSSAYSTLMVDIDERSRVERKVKEVKGRQVR